MTTGVLHALATGLPVITTNHGAFSEQVVEGKNGFMVPEGDYKALAEKIVYLLEHSEIWPDFGQQGRQLVLEKFNAKVLIEKQIEIYRAILDR